MKISETQAKMERTINELTSEISRLTKKGGLLNLQEAKRLELKLQGYQDCYLTYMSYKP